MASATRPAPWPSQAARDLAATEPAFAEALASAFNRLRDPALRADLAAKSLAACDGQGAGRVADAILAQLSRIASAAGS